MAASSGMDVNTRVICMKMIMKSSDVSNCARSTNIYLKWVDRICEEFYEQGDIEKDLGLPISPFMDRRITQINKSQIGFIDFATRPLFTALNAHFPISGLLANIEANKAHWEQIGNKRKISLTVTVKAITTAHRIRRNSLVNLAAGTLPPENPNHTHVSENIDNHTFMKNLRTAAFGAADQQGNNPQSQVPFNEPEKYESFKTKRRRSMMIANGMISQ